MASNLYYTVYTTDVRLVIFWEIFFLFKIQKCLLLTALPGFDSFCMEAENTILMEREG